MTDLFLAHKHAQWQRLIKRRDALHRRRIRDRAALQRRIDALALKILEAETGRQAA